MFYWDNYNNDKITEKEKVADLFFSRIAGQKKVSTGKGILSFSTNYETDDKKVIADESLPVINLKNRNLEAFKQALAEYAKAFMESEKSWTTPLNMCNTVQDKLVYGIVAALLNMTYDDFEHPVEFMNRYTQFLRDKSFDEFFGGRLIKNIQTLNNCDIEIRLSDQDIFQETPDALTFTVQKGDISRKLPRIAYGIAGDTAYIYGIQGYKNEKSNDKELKKIDRKRYQLNNKENILGDYQEEFLAQEPYAYLSLFAFMCLLKQKGIYKIKMPDFLPSRYIGHAQRYKENIEECDRIHFNTTNKFLSYMSRMECDVPGIKIEETPNENDSGLLIDISKMEVTPQNNIIFYELAKKIETVMKQKSKDDSTNER